MTDDKKGRSLILLGITLFAAILLAMGMPRLELKLGVPLPAPEGRSQAIPMASTGLPPISVNTFVLAIMGILLGGAFLYCGYQAIRGTNWKAILSSLRFVGILGLVFTAVVLVLFSVGHFKIAAPDSAPENLPEASSFSGPKLGPLPGGLIWLVWAGLGLLTVLLVFWVIRQQAQRRRERDLLSVKAEEALQALKSGESFKNVIVRCYREMSLVLQREQGIELEQSMTAQEFKRLLEARGVPHAPIDELTRLFEAARYGQRSPTAEDERAAFDCLNSIGQHIRDKKKAALR